MTAPPQIDDLVEVAAALEQGAEEFLSDRVSADATVDTLWPELTALGWFEMLLPEADGGLALSPVALGGIVRAAGRHLVPGPLLEHLFVAPFLLAALTDPNGQEALRSAVGGAFLALADPDAGVAGDDAPRRDADGRLTGVVRLVPHAGRADLFVVVARDDDRAEHLVVVDRHDRGVRVQARSALTQTHEVADVVLEAAVGTALCCPVDVLVQLRTWMRVLSAAWLLGVAEQVLALTVAYVAQRKQFGRVVGSFQAVQHTVADMSADVAMLGNLVSSTLARLTEEAVVTSYESGLAVKAHAAQACLGVCESALQMHGGIGFTTDYHLQRFYKSAIALRGYYGEPEDLYLEIGQRAVH